MRPHQVRRSRRTRSLPAFTLVELLVVIGIIALLISVLLPALNKARQQANKTKCLAGLRSLGQAVSIYAAENKDRVPIGFVATASTTTGVTALQFPLSNYVWFGNASNGNQRDNGLGLLARTKMVTRGPQAFYCPTETRERLMYDTIDNPWVYKIAAPETYPWVNGLSLVYISYMCRPVAAWPSVPFNDPNADKAYLIEGYFPISTTVKTHPAGYPLLSKLKSKAIISELMRSPQDVKVMHKDGINVYYANGSGRFVPLSDFNKAAFGTSGPFGGGSSNAWAKFDYVLPDGRLQFPAGDDALNQVFLNSNPKFPASAGVWNWLDKAMN